MSSGFITESEVNEASQRKQEGWEKVRQPDEPLERLEEPYVGCSLFERLKEQKMKKDLDYEETHKLKNLISSLDDDVVQFLEIVDENEMDMEKKQMLEEEKELMDFRATVATLKEESVDKKLKDDLKIKTQASNATDRLSQKSLLRIAIEGKHREVKSPVTDTCKKLKLNECEDIKREESPTEYENKIKVKDIKDLPFIQTRKLDKGEFKCVAILPGLGPYNESSDSEISSGSDDDPEVCEEPKKYDLVPNKKFATHSMKKLIRKLLKH